MFSQCKRGFEYCFYKIFGFENLDSEKKKWREKWKWKIYHIYVSYLNIKISHVQNDQVSRINCKKLGCSTYKLDLFNVKLNFRILGWTLHYWYRCMDINDGWLDRKNLITDDPTDLWKNSDAILKFWFWPNFNSA
jgi:hypothetical protein